MERNHEQSYKERRDRVQRLAKEMGKLYTPSHYLPQTDAYEAVRMEYLQAMTDAEYPDLPPGTHSHYNCG